jgi:hypothetical protein
MNNFFSSMMKKFTGNKDNNPEDTNMSNDLTSSLIFHAVSVDYPEKLNDYVKGLKYEGNAIDK